MVAIIQQGQYNSESIYQQLKKEILKLELLPGQAISENETCSRFTVSRTPVRTAFQRLQAEGLLQVTPYKGSFVTLLDFPYITQTIYMRTAIESAVLRDFLLICTPMLEEKIRYNIRKQTILLQTDFEEEHFYQLDANLHKIWFAATEKMLLWKMIQAAEVHYTRFRMLDIVKGKNFQSILQEHEYLFEAIQAKDAPKLALLTQQHMYGGIERLKERMETDLREYFTKSN